MFLSKKEIIIYDHSRMLYRRSKNWRVYLFFLNKSCVQCKKKQQKITVRKQTKLKKSTYIFQRKDCQVIITYNELSSLFDRFYFGYFLGHRDIVSVKARFVLMRMRYTPPACIRLNAFFFRFIFRDDRWTQNKGKKVNTFIHAYI